MRGLFKEFAIARDKRIAERDRDVSLAWWITALAHGTKKLIPLEKLLLRNKPKKQTKQDHRAALQMIFGNRRARPSH